MIRIYCDRCGKVVTNVPQPILEQVAYIGGDLQFSITRTSEIIGYPSKQIDLCVDCRKKIKQMIIDFLDESKDIADKIDNASGGARMKTEKIVQYVEESLSNIYCKTCKNSGNDDVCDYCHRKSMMWQISHEAAESIVDGIVKILEGEQDD